MCPTELTPYPHLHASHLSWPCSGSTITLDLDFYKFCINMLQRIDPPTGISPYNLSLSCFTVLHNEDLETRTRQTRKQGDFFCSFPQSVNWMHILSCNINKWFLKAHFLRSRFIWRWHTFWRHWWSASCASTAPYCCDFASLFQFLVAVYIGPTVPLSNIRCQLKGKWKIELF